MSNVVNGYRPVGEATRQRVQRAIDELGYRPNLSARHLRNGRTGLIAASLAAMGHLLDLGRRRIAFIGAQADVNPQPAHLRLHGYQEALAAAGIDYDPDLVVTTDYFSRADGAGGLRQLMNLRHPPDAVFAYNDLIAIGVLRAAVEVGLRVPEDIAVVGFDDIEEGRYSNPTLTTISPDKGSIGSHAVTCLIGRLEGSRTAEPEEVQVPFTLITRESTLGRRP